MRLSHKLTVVVLGFGILVLGSSARAANFNIDPYHSSVNFKVKHVVGKVAGKFGKFSGTFNYDPTHLDKTSAQAMIEIASIDTGIEKRDNHLRTPEFFDAQKYPTLTFKSTGITDVSGTTAKLHGDLTMHGVTKPVVLDLIIEGVAQDPKGNSIAGASAIVHINRADFGVGPTSGAMAGMIGSDIEIDIEVEGKSE
jgi:polyisoprenoid-binding protein YceI